MPRSARRALGTLLLASGVSLLPRPAAADELVRLDYRAPVECPDVPDFIARVKQRVPSARIAAPEDQAREIVVVVSTDEEGFMARLDFVDVRGERITRTLAGNTCDEVVSGIALVTALALEAQRDLAGNAGSAAPAGPQSPGDDVPVNVPPPSPAVARPTPARARREGPRPQRRPPRRAEASRHRVVHGAGVGGGNAWYVAPGTPVVLDAVYRLAHTSLSGSARAGFRSWLSTAEVSGRSATFVGYASTFEGCPFAWPRDGRVRVEPCVGITLGALEGRGDRSASLPNVDSARIFWADARGIARLRLALTTLVEVEAQGEAGRPLRAHRFLFQNPDQTVFEVPEAGLGWRAGVMLHFP